MSPQADNPNLMPVPAGNETPPQLPTPSEQMPPVPETAPVRPELSPAPAPSSATPLPTLPPTPPAAPASGQNATDDVSITTNPNLPAIADDGDLIEKEWVNKAKQIVAATRDNPTQQSQQVSELKADYMQKRYNKTLKMSG